MTKPGNDHDQARHGLKLEVEQELWLLSPFWRLTLWVQLSVLRLTLRATASLDRSTDVTIREMASCATGRWPSDLNINHPHPTSNWDSISQGDRSPSLISQHPLCPRIFPNHVPDRPSWIFYAKNILYFFQQMHLAGFVRISGMPTFHPAASFVDRFWSQKK